MIGVWTILFISFKHLRVRLRQSLVAVLSVALGAMILVVTLCMMEGLLEEFKYKLLEASPPIIVEPRPTIGPSWIAPEGPGPLAQQTDNIASPLRSLRRGSPPDEKDEINRFTELDALIRSIDGVKAVAPRACSPVVMRHGTRSERSMVCGIEPAVEKNVTRLYRWMRQGRMDDLGASGGSIILGRLLAEHLSARMGSRLWLVAPSGVIMDFRVVGIFASGVTRIDDRQAFVRLSEGRNLAALPGGSVTSVGINVYSLHMSEELARKITRMTGYEAMTWEEANASAIGAFRMMGMSTYFLVIFTAIVGGFGILNIMVTIVMEKTKDIALFMSMGYTARQVMQIFFIEALVLGVAGGTLGCLIGFAATTILGSIPMPTTESAALQRDYMGMLQDPWFYVTAFAISLLISLAAGVSPARRAARVDPVAVLRGEK